MSEPSKEDKTEAATQRRLEQAAAKGQLPVGRDANAVAALCAAFFALLQLGPGLAADLARLVAIAAGSAADPAPGRLLALASRPVAGAVGVIAAAAAGALLVGMAQTRGRVWGHLAAPDPERLWQLAKLKRLFSREMLADLGLAFVKIVAVGSAGYLALRDDFLTLPSMLRLQGGQLVGRVFAPLASALPWLVAALLLVAGVDLAITRVRFAARMRMTKEELKREQKEEEGDPLLRGQRRRRHREMAKARVATEVPLADVLVVNPTHVAVAVRYRRGRDRAPRITAKGKGQLAEIMRDLARSSGVPIVQDVPLARLLHRRVKVGAEVPADTYKAVAAILALVYRMTGRSAA